MNISDVDTMTLSDDEAREATIPVRPLTSREGRSGAGLSLRARSDAFLQTTAFFRIGTASISPKLRKAILGLHRDDALRRAYVRRCWMETGET